MSKCKKCKKGELVRFKREETKRIIKSKHICDNCEDITTEKFDKVKAKKERLAQEKKWKEESEKEEAKLQKKIRLVDWTKVKCPYCKKNLNENAFPPDLIQHLYDCPHCNNTLRLCKKCIKVYKIIELKNLTYEKCPKCGHKNYPSDTCDKCHKGIMKITGGCDPVFDTKCNNCGHYGKMYT